MAVQYVHFVPDPPNRGPIPHIYIVHTCVHTRFQMEHILLSKDENATFIKKVHFLTSILIKAVCTDILLVTIGCGLIPHIRLVLCPAQKEKISSNLFVIFAPRWGSFVSNFSTFGYHSLVHIGTFCPSIHLRPLLWGGVALYPICCTGSQVAIHKQPLAH